MLSVSPVRCHWQGETHSLSTKKQLEQLQKQAVNKDPYDDSPYSTGLAKAVWPT